MTALMTAVLNKNPPFAQKEIEKFWFQFEIGSLHYFVLKNTILELSCLGVLHASQLMVRVVLQFLTSRISWWAMDAKFDLKIFNEVVLHCFLQTQEYLYAKLSCEIS